MTPQENARAKAQHHIRRASALLGKTEGLEEYPGAANRAACALAHATVATYWQQEATS